VSVQVVDIDGIDVPEPHRVHRYGHDGDVSGTQ
jgi:hypothetical protein